MGIEYEYNGIKYGFQRGGFDNYQVYNEKDGKRYSPFDRDYMQDLLLLRDDNRDVYNDFVKVYERTNKHVDQYVFTLIKKMSQNYSNNDLFITTMVNIYLTMIAEENKCNTRLGKRIKRIAIHKILVEDINVNRAVNAHRGIPWRDIDAECNERGF